MSDSIKGKNRVVDCHQHAFWHGRDDAGLIADMDQHGISLAWLLSWEIAPFEDDRIYHGLLNPKRFRGDGTHMGIVLEDLLTARDHYPDRFLVGFCPHPLMGDAPARLEAAVRMYGVKVCGEWKFRMLFDDPRCLELYHKAGECNLPVILHLDVPFLRKENRLVYQPNWYGGTVSNLETALKACPETNFVGHAPGFWREISAGADESDQHYPEGPILSGGKIDYLLETYSNLYADLSAGSALGALRRDLAFSRKFLIRFQDKLLFARDFYGNKLHEFLQTLDLPNEVTRKIYSGNAERLVPSSK